MASSFASVAKLDVLPPSFAVFSRNSGTTGSSYCCGDAVCCAAAKVEDDGLKRLLRFPTGEAGIGV